jgi:DNA-binding transcriptional LysR family regulator
MKLMPEICWRLGSLAFGLYAAAHYLDQRTGQDWRRFDWVMPCGPMSQRPVVQWLASQILPEHQVLATDSFIAMHALAVQGVGGALLPKYMGLDERLRPVAPVPPEDAGQLWLLTHAKLRHTRRIQAFMQHLAESIRGAAWLAGLKRLTGEPATGSRPSPARRPARPGRSGR